MVVVWHACAKLFSPQNVVRPFPPTPSSIVPGFLGPFIATGDDTGIVLPSFPAS